MIQRCSESQARSVSIFPDKLRLFPFVLQNPIWDMACSRYTKLAEPGSAIYQYYPPVAPGCDAPISNYVNSLFLLNFTCINLPYESSTCFSPRLGFCNPAPGYGFP